MTNTAKSTWNWNVVDAAANSTWNWNVDAPRPPPSVAPGTGTDLPAPPHALRATRYPLSFGHLSPASKGPTS